MLKFKCSVYYTRKIKFTKQHKSEGILVVNQTLLEQIKYKCKKREKGDIQLRLKKSEMNVLILAYRDGDDEAGEMIYKAVELFITKMAYEYAKNIIGNGVSFDEILMNCKEKIMPSLKNYQIDSNAAFTTYLAKAVKNEVAEIGRKLRRDKIVVSLSEGVAKRKKRNPEKNDKTYEDILMAQTAEVNIENVLNKADIEKVLNKLGAEYRDIIVKHYFEHKTFKKIGEETNTSKQNIHEKNKNALKKLGELLRTGYADLADNTNDVPHVLIDYYRKCRAEYEKVKDKIDFEKELLPYLSEDHKFVFNNVIKEFKVKNLRKLSNELGKSGPYIRQTVDVIFDKIYLILIRKQEIEKFYETIGGKEQLEDLRLFLDEDQKTVLDKVILSVDPNANRKVKKEISNKKTSISKIQKSILNVSEEIFDRRKQCEKFIAENGGEDFLIYEFGATLSDEYFEIMLYTMMDYHYTNLSEFSNDYLEHHGDITAIQEDIKMNLEVYRNRKIEVDKMVEDAGGVEKLDMLFYSLNELEKHVFIERFIAYYQTPQDEMAKNYGVLEKEISESEIKVNELINKLIDENYQKKQMQ